MSASERPIWPYVAAGCGAAVLLAPVLLCVGFFALASGHEGGVRYANTVEPYAETRIAEQRVLELSEGALISGRRRRRGRLGST